MKKTLSPIPGFDDQLTSAFQSQPTPPKKQENADTSVVSKKVSKNISKSTYARTDERTDTDSVESLCFRIRKMPMTRVSADIPAEWKKKIDDEAYRLRVGKYDLLKYIIARYLGEVGE